MDKELAMQLLKVVLQEDKTEVKEGEERIKIAVLQRGWNVIGRAKQIGEKVFMRDAYVIRKWGTSEGLGQLALKGKQSETILDKTGNIEFDVLTSVFLIDCNQEIWQSEL